VATFNILHLQNNQVFKYVDTVSAVDDTTVAFHMFNPSSVMPRFVLRQWIRAASVYGDIAGRAQALFDAGKTQDDQEWKDLITELNDFRPEQFGPAAFTLAPTTSRYPGNAANAPTCLAGNVKFDTIILYNGEIHRDPLVMNREVHYATHGFPPATELAFDALGVRILRPPIYTGPALFFNYASNPLFADPKFRQAIAYAVDRDQNGAIALGRSGKRQVYMAGFSDNLLPTWLTADQLAALNTSDYDPAIMTNCSPNWPRTRRWRMGGQRQQPAVLELASAEFADGQAKPEPGGSAQRLASRSTAAQF
jgi:peptide/nickel transport system substrate-binding protein